MSQLKVGTKNIPMILSLFSLGMLMMQAVPVLAANQYAVNCTSCHGMPPTDSAQRDPVAGTFQGNHSVHLPANAFANSTTQTRTAYAAQCTKCHNNSGYTIDHYNGAIQMAAKINNYSSSAGKARYLVFSSPAGRTAGSKPVFFNQTSLPQFATCSNVNCHFEKTTQKWSGANPTSQPASCQACHGYPNPTPGSASGTTHDTHFTKSNVLAISWFGGCDVCHSDPRLDPAGKIYQHATSASKRALILDPSVHYAGNNANYLPSQASQRVFGSCSNLYCHSNGTTTTAPFTANRNPTWGSTLPSDCSGCHGGNAASASPIATGKHTQHTNNAALGGSFGCVQCHAATVSADTTIASVTNHANQIKDYSGTNAGTYTTATGVCATVYCHSNGQSTPVYRTVASWTSATAYGCNGCHGADTTGADPAGYFTATAAGEPNYNNYTTAGSIYRNSHLKHVQTGSIGCQVCHASTTADGATILSGSATHINKTRDISFNTANAAASYNSALKSCSNTQCHGTTTVRWGSVGAGVSGCLSCHSNIATSGSHAAHIGLLINTVTFYNYTANKSTGTEVGAVAGDGYSFGCANCHPINTALHQNGVKNVEVANVAGVSTLRAKNTSGTVTVTTSGSNVTCANIYCHSNGQTGAGLVYASIPNWYGGKFSTADKCANCHGNSPTSGAHAAHAVGIHYDDLYNGVLGNYSAARTVGKPAGHGDPAQSTTMSCNICHNSTINVAYNANNGQCNSCHTVGTAATAAKGNFDAKITDRALHVNGKTDLNFVTTAINTKAQLRDTSFSSYTAAGGFWNRSGGYKAGAASFDTAKTNLNNSMFSAGTCSNIACHNGKAVNWTSDVGAAKDCTICHSKL